MGFDYDEEEQDFVEWQVEFSIPGHRLAEVRDFPNLLRERGWIVEAGGYLVDNDTEGALSAAAGREAPWYLQAYEGRRAHARAAEMLGAVRRLLEVLAPDDGTEGGRTISQGEFPSAVARAALAMPETVTWPLFAATFEHARIARGLRWGADPAAQGYSISKALDVENDDMQP